MKHLLIFLFTIQSFLVLKAQENPNFYLHDNGVTIVCNNAEVGETGEINGITYTKRQNSSSGSSNYLSKENFETSCTSGITNMEGQIHGTDFSGDISHWDVSSVTNMKQLFYTETSFKGDISKWDVSNVIDMSEMFDGADFNSDISSWNTESVTNMYRMFMFSEFDGDISSWNTSNVTNMKQMFNNAKFSGDITNWDVSNVTDMSGMFYENHFYNSPLNDWDVSNVVDFTAMFAGSSVFNQYLGDWNVVSAQTMERMFENAVSFNQDLSRWCVTNIANEPSLIFENNSIPEAHKPIWGTCPEIQGTDEIPLYIPTDGLVAWYPFNGNANDESGNGNNGTVNGATLTTDKDGNENSAYSFDGVDDFIEFNLPKFDEKITLSLKIYTNEFSEGAHLRLINTSEGSGGGNDRWFLAVAPNSEENKIHFGIENNSTESLNGNTTLGLENWHHIVVIFNSGSVKLFVDGMIDGNTTFNTSLSHIDALTRVGSGNGNSFYSGQIDDIAIWNRALTEEEIQAVYNQGAVEPPMSAIHTYVPNQTVFSIDTTFTSVYLEDVPAEGFNAFQYTLNYDPDSLNVELLDNMGTLSEGFDLGINTVNPGQIIVAGSRVDPVTENGKLSNLKISYNTGGISHITLDDVMFNEGVPAATTGDARIESTLLVCGDVTGDNGVSALDASHILRHTVRLAPQYPLEGRDFIAGDVTSNGAVTAYDAYFVLREIVGLSAGLNCSSTVYNLKEAWAPKLDWSILTKGSRIVTPLYFTEDTPEIYALEVEVPNSMEVSVVGIPEDWNTLEYTNEGTQYISMYGLSPLTTTELVWNKVTGGMVEARVRINESEWQTIEQELEVDQVLPQEYTLSQNYPNPFNPSTQIQYALPEATQVTLEVFNSVGQKVMELVNGQKSAGYHTATFDASQLSSGVYLYKLTTPGFSQTKKMLLIK